MFLAASADADDLDDDDDNCNLKAAVGLDDVEGVGAKRRLRVFQDSFHAQKRKVPGTIAETFGMAANLENQEPPAVVGT